DESVQSRRVHFDLDATDFFTAMQAADDVTGAFWTPLAEKQVFIAKDTQENRRLYERMGMRRFVISSDTMPQDLQEIVNVLRTVFEIRFLQQQAASGELIVRA